MEPVTLAVVSLAVLMLLLSFGVPIVFCFSGALAFMSIVGGVTMKGMMMWGLQQILSPTLLCIPLFIYAGSLMSESGIAKYLLEFVDVFVGRIRGGLGFVATLTCAILGAISGSTFTGLAATGNMLIPEMVSRGYPRAFATALITCSSILGVLIPPSTPMIIFGWVTGTNVLACFLSTVGPGIVTIIIFCGINFVLSRRFDLKLMPQLSKTEKRRQIAVRGWKALPALIMPVLILGGIYSGAMTPTEAAAVAVIYALPVGFFVYRGLNLRNAFGCTKDSAVSVGSIMIMIFCSMMLSQTYVVLQIPQAIVESVFSITDNSFLILLLINLILLFVGMIVNDTTGIILVAPLLLPLAKAIGLDPIQYAAIFGVNLAVGSLTPPYASLLYLGIRIGKVDFVEILPYVGLFLLGYVPVMLLTTLLARREPVHPPPVRFHLAGRGNRHLPGHGRRFPRRRPYLQGGADGAPPKPFTTGEHHEKGHVCTGAVRPAGPFRRFRICGAVEACSHPPRRLRDRARFAGFRQGSARGNQRAHRHQDLWLQPAWGLHRRAGKGVSRLCGNELRIRFHAGGQAFPLLYPALCRQGLRHREEELRHRNPLRQILRQPV